MQGAKSRLKQVELRTLVAHVIRCIADGARPGALRSEAPLRTCVLDFIGDTIKYLGSATPGQYSNRVCICLCFLIYFAHHWGCTLKANLSRALHVSPSSRSCCTVRFVQCAINMNPPFD